MPADAAPRLVHAQDMPKDIQRDLEIAQAMVEAMCRTAAEADIRMGCVLNAMISQAALLVARQPHDVRAKVAHQVEATFRQMVDNYYLQINSGGHA